MTDSLVVIDDQPLDVPFNALRPADCVAASHAKHVSIRPRDTHTSAV